MNNLNGKYVYRKVMVIEDNQTDSYIASYNLKKNLFAEEVIAMETAGAALKYLKASVNSPEELPQLIFLDIKMPGQDGFEFLKEYEKLPLTIREKCIIMMLTSSLNPQDDERAKSNKYVCRFMVKPLTKEVIESLKDIMTEKLSPLQGTINFILSLDSSRTQQELEALSEHDLRLLKVKLEYWRDSKRHDPFRASIPHTKKAARFRNKKKQ